MGGKLIFIDGEGGPPYGGGTHFGEGGMDPGGHPDIYYIIMFKLSISRLIFSGGPASLLLIFTLINRNGILYVDNDSFTLI